MKLIDKLKAIKVTEFKFVSFAVRTTTDDKGATMQYVVFELSEPIPVVVGTQRLYHPVERSKSVLIQADDVTAVECEFSIIDEFESEFVFDEEDGKLVGTGSYGGSLRLDVSKNDRVWLVKESLAKRANAWKSGQTAKRIEDMIAAQNK